MGIGRKSASRVAAARVETGMSRRNNGISANPLEILKGKERVCDMCGAKTSMLRVHAGGLVCWTCKASTIKD